MALATKRVIGPSERPWGTWTKFQNRFFGVYELDASTGLFFPEGPASGARHKVIDAARRLPDQLQQILRQWQVTVSFCGNLTWTPNGSCSTFYADFRQSDPARISPHIEMSDRSLEPQLVLPHLTHEASHLWWRTRCEQAREAYARFLVDTCSDKTVEVTYYVQEKFEDWLRTLAIPDAESYAENHRRSSRQVWVEESFADTVALIHVPAYPSRHERCTVDLDWRRRQIHSLTGLALAALS